MKETQQRNSKLGPPPGSEISVSGPSNDLAQEPATFFDVDQLLESRNHHAGIVKGASEPLVSQIGPQGRPGDKSQVAATQLSDSCNNKATADSMERQCPELTDILDKSRSISPQEASKAIQMAQSSLGQLVSLLQRSTSTSTEGSDASEIAALQDLLEKEQQNNQRLTGDHRNLIKEYKRLDHAYEKQSDELHKTNDRLSDALLKIDQLRQLLEGGTFANSAKTTDSAILGIWKQLAYNIRNLAYILARTTDIGELSDTVTTRLRRVTTEYTKLFQDQDHSHALMQGYLWGLIEDRIFKPDRSDRLTRGGSQTTSWKLAKDDIYSQILSKKGKNPDYLTTLAHAARCFSQVSTMFSKLWDDDPGFIKQLVSWETQLLQPFFLRRSARTDRTEKKINEQLNEIVQSAIELDKMMMCSKAYFMIEWQPPAKKSHSNNRYDKEFMESDIHEVEPSSKSRVKFFMSPILLKTGTADGQKYDTTNVLAKASVVCN